MWIGYEKCEIEMLFLWFGDFCYFCENKVLSRIEEKQQKVLSVKLKSTVKENESFSNKTDIWVQKQVK